MRQRVPQTQIKAAQNGWVDGKVVEADAKEKEEERDKTEIAAGERMRRENLMMRASYCSN